MAGPTRPARVYLDTSVIGGCLDDEFRAPSLRLFNRSRIGGILLVLSDITLAELAAAPASVRSVIEDLPRGRVELIRQSTESDALAEEYIRQAVVSRRMLADAQHIAVARVDVLASWNFRHIVNWTGSADSTRSISVPAIPSWRSDHPWSFGPMMTKTFDSVKLMRTLRDKLSRDMENMTAEERLRYIRATAASTGLEVKMAAAEPDATQQQA